MCTSPGISLHVEKLFNFLMICGTILIYGRKYLFVLFNAVLAPPFLLHTFTYFYMLLNAFTCFYTSVHAFTYFYTCLHAFTCFDMPLHALTCFEVRNKFIRSDTRQKVFGISLPSQLAVFNDVSPLSFGIGYIHLLFYNCFVLEIM